MAGAAALTDLAVGDGATITDMVNPTVQRHSARLTPREREVLALVAAGISNKGIARALQVSPNTVKFHIAALLEKLDAATRAGAVVAALRRGELSL
jgi:two-component system, NarL family, nitrate/nitrite response regulator NarL